MNPITFVLFLFVFLYGIVIGSFLNVLIYRLPNGEDIVLKRSHCMKCGYILKWYDLIPIISFLFLKGKCRKCNDKISLQYPMIELLNGIFYLLIFYIKGFHITSIIYCLFVSTLIVISVIDWITFEIPIGLNYFIFILAIIIFVINIENWIPHVIGFFAISGFLFIIYLCSKGRAIGGGDIKLMAVCGFLLGFKLIILSFILGCIFGSVIHLIRMRISNQDNRLAFGPYLCFGMFLALLFGNQLISWYFNLLMIS